MGGAIAARLAPGRLRTVDASARAATFDSDWPRTTRPLPWLLAAFLAMVWLTPFDAIDLPISLPFDTKLDRLFLAAIAVVWLLAVAAARPGGPRLRQSAIQVAVLMFVAIAFLSVILNAEVLANLDQMGVAVKKLVLLLSYTLFFYVVATSVRPSELRAFTVLLMGLACVSSVGLIYEYRTGTNLFYDWTALLLPDSISVGSPPLDSKFGRPTVVGPTEHGLAIATLFAMALPFAVVRMMTAPDRRARLISFAATGLMLAGAMGTLRKTGAVAPAAALVVLMLYRPRGMLRLLPAGLILLIGIQLVTPGAMTRIKAQLVGGVAEQSSTQGRTDDYDAVLPDVLTNPVLGRGYGTYDSAEYRILDNEYLGTVIETGLLGVVAYLGVIVAVMLVCHRVIRRPQPGLSPTTALAASAAAVAFAVATGLFDVLSFPHAPYMFFFVAGLAVVATARRTGPSQGLATAPSGGGV